jgi:hypothetical protein
VYRAELKRFGIDVVVAVPGNMRTGGPAKTAAALQRVADDMTAEQRELYGDTFGSFANALNSMQNKGLDSVSAAAKVIALAEQMPAPSRGPVGADAEDVLRAVREKSDAEPGHASPPTRWSDLRSVRPRRRIEEGIRR